MHYVVTEQQKQLTRKTHAAKMSTGAISIPFLFILFTLTYIKAQPSQQVTIDISVQLEPDDSKLSHREPVGSDLPAASLGLHQFLGLMGFSFLVTSTRQAQTLHSIY